MSTGTPILCRVVFPVFHQGPGFTPWQPGQGAFMPSLAEKDDLVTSIKTQEEFHKGVSFREEYEALLKKAGLILNTTYEY